MIALCIIVVAIRLGVRVWRRAWSYWVSDVFLVLGVVCFIFLAIADIVTAAAEEEYSDSDDSKTVLKVSTPLTCTPCYR